MREVTQLRTSCLSVQCKIKSLRHQLSVNWGFKLSPAESWEMMCWDRWNVSLLLQPANGNHYVWLAGLAAWKQPGCLCDWHTGLPTGSQMEFVIKQRALRIMKASVRSLSTWTTVKFHYCVWQQFICIYPSCSDSLCLTLKIPIVQTVMSTCQSLIRSEKKIISSDLLFSCHAFHAALLLTYTFSQPNLCFPSLRVSSPPSFLPLLFALMYLVSITPTHPPHPTTLCTRHPG